MAIKVGINGFGRIGRMVFRAAVENFSKDIQVVGINDLLDADYLAYMLKYDSVHGIFNHEIKVDGNFLIVDGNKIQIFAEKECFHPKLYLVRKKDNTFSALVGSANLTNGGLNNNIELTTYITDQDVCKSILKWFNEIYKQGKPLTTTFVEQYQVEFAERLERKKKEDKVAKKEKNILIEEFNVVFTEKNLFIKTLNEYRQKNEYSRINKKRRKYHTSHIY